MLYNETSQFCLQTLAFIAIGVGTVFSIIFHIGTPERREDDDLKTAEQKTSKAQMAVLPANLELAPAKLEGVPSDFQIPPQYEITDSKVIDQLEQPDNMKWYHWLQEHQFYQVDIV